MNPPPIQWIPVFVTAAKLMNFRKAAEQLNVSPPAVSQQVKSLEEYLGTPLFVRNGPNLQLTEAGSFFYQYAKETYQSHLTGFKEFDRRFNHRSLRISTPLFIAQEILIPNYLEFKKLEPKAELRITTGTEYVDFETSSADAAIRFGTGDWPELHSQLLCDAKTSPICSADFIKTNNLNNLPLKQILNSQVLLSTNEELLDWKYLYPDIQIKEAIICDSYFSAIKSAEQGIGIALGLFPAINAWINDKRLVQLTNEFHDTPSGYWMVYPKNRTDTQLLESCYEWAKTLFDSLPELAFK